MKNYGIRNKQTGEITARFDDPIEAASHITDKTQEEVAERSIVNVYETLPDGKTYITGIEERWKAFQI